APQELAQRLKDDAIFIEHEQAGFGFGGGLHGVTSGRWPLVSGQKLLATEHWPLITVSPGQRTFIVFIVKIGRLHESTRRDFDATAAADMMCGRNEGPVTPKGLTCALACQKK